MKHKTWFRLVLKAIGVLLVGFALPEILDRSTGFIDYAFIQQRWDRNLVTLLVVGTAAPLLQAALGLYLFFGGDWVVNKAIPSNRPYCPECGYELSRAPGARCPECGVAKPAGDARVPGA